MLDNLIMTDDIKKFVSESREYLRQWGPDFPLWEDLQFKRALDIIEEQDKMIRDMEERKMDSCD